MQPLSLDPRGRRLALAVWAAVPGAPLGGLTRRTPTCRARTTGLVPAGFHGGSLAQRDHRPDAPARPRHRFVDTLRVVAAIQNRDVRREATGSDSVRQDGHGQDTPLNKRSGTARGQPSRLLRPSKPGYGMGRWNPARGLGGYPTLSALIRPRYAFAGGQPAFSAVVTAGDSRACWGLSAASHDPAQ